MKKLIYTITGWIERIRAQYLPSIGLLHLTAVFIGLLCGFGAGLLKLIIGWFTSVVFSSFDVTRLNFLFLLLPLAGIILAMLFSRYLVRHNMEHGSEQVAGDLASGNLDLNPKLILGPMIGCTLTLGLGGSAGAEGPIAYTGGAVGSNMGKAFKATTDEMEHMVACGSAAAIAGIFMAPIGGVMFALEVLKCKLSMPGLLSMTVASLTAALTTYIMLGCHTDITFVPEMRFDMIFLPHVIAGGIVCGLYSVYYRAVMRRIRRWFGTISNFWLRAVTGGLMLGVLLLLFPSLYGEGYGIVHKLMLNDPASVVSYSPLYPLSKDPVILMLLCVALLLVKPFATSATNDSGGVGGSFTPTFFCGGVLGFLFASALNYFLGWHMPYALFAFFGMSAVMAGAIGAPLMAIFICAEMTGLYGFILPLSLAALTSYLTVVFANYHRPIPAKS